MILLSFLSLSLLLYRFSREPSVNEFNSISIDSTNEEGLNGNNEEVGHVAAV
jgi:hypothetical protein